MLQGESLLSAVNPRQKHLQECVLTLPKMLLHYPLAARFVFILLQHC